MTTPLHAACSHGDVGCIKLLLESGADANVYDVVSLWYSYDDFHSLSQKYFQRGFAPLHCAAHNNHTPTIDTMLKSVPLGDSDFTQKCEVNQGSEYGETPLHIACLAGNYEAAAFLHDRGADLECVDVEGNTFLHCISASNNKRLWSWAMRTVDSSGLHHLINKRNIVCETYFCHKINFNSMEVLLNYGLCTISYNYECINCAITLTLFSMPRMERLLPIALPLWGMW